MSGIGNSAARDANQVPTLLALSSVDGTSTVTLYADPTTHRLLTDTASGNGTVTSVSVVSANGFAGTVATATTTPAITLSTTVTGIIKGNGTTLAAATSGTDYTALAFKTLVVSGQSNIVAGTASDTLTIVAGSGMTITTNAGTNTLTFVASGGSATSVTVGTTAISSGTTTRILYDNAGVLGEYTLTGSGTVVAMQTAPTFVTSITAPLIIGGSGTTGTQLTLQTTTGVGTTDALVIKGGNNGASTFATFTTGGALTLSTSGTLTTGTIELGAASDTTLARVSAGVISVEGVTVDTASNTLTLTNKTITDGVNNVATPTTTSIGYLGIPQNSQVTAYTTVLTDAGKMIFHPASDTSVRTYTIDSNANVAYPIGTTLTFINQTSQVVSIAITTDTMTLANSTTTGTRSLAQNGVATAVKVAATSWIISGVGLS